MHANKNNVIQLEVTRSSKRWLLSDPRFATELPIWKISSYYNHIGAWHDYIVLNDLTEAFIK